MSHKTSTAMYESKLVGALIKLRQNHLEETKKFFLDEMSLIADLTHLCQARLLEAKTPFDKVEVIRFNSIAIKNLRVNRDKRYLALRNRHKEEIDNFLDFREELSLRTVGVVYA